MELIKDTHYEGERPLFATHNLHLENVTIHFTEHLRRFYQSVCHLQIIGIPEGSTCSFRKQAVFHNETIVMPERIFSFETAIYSFDITTFFQGRFTGMDCYVFQMKIVSGEPENE